MRPVNKSNPPCPDCGGRTNKDGVRAHTNIKRYRCAGEVENTKCWKKPRRFSDLTKDEKLETAVSKAPVETRNELRDDTHVFLITWAQNATPVEPNFWKALNACREHRNADLVVIQGRYRNPTTREDSGDDEWWVKEVMDAGLWANRVDLCPILTLMADMRVQPTAKRPLTGLDSMTGGKSGIIGHPKLELRFIATPQNALAKQMMTTGACTVQNYSDSKAGKTGEFNHTIGALIVEIKDGVFFARQINAVRDGSFIDLDTEYFPDGSWQDADRALALCMGDWHDGFTAPHVIDATFGVGQKDCIVGIVKPEIIFWDDLLDQYGRNHHHKDNPFIAFAKQFDTLYDRGDLMHEVSAACESVNFYTRQTEELLGMPVQSIVKQSNHDDALTRYIIDRNWKSDPQNAEFYLETSLRMIRATTMSETGAQYPSAFAVWASELMPEVLMLGRRGSYMVADIECIYHGDIGPNGARGSIMNFSKIGVKTVIGHSHTPGIVDGCYQSGTSTYLELEYARGPSSWSNTHTVIYANGKRSLITIIDGKFRHE